MKIQRTESTDGVPLAFIPFQNIIDVVINRFSIHTTELSHEVTLCCHCWLEQWNHSDGKKTRIKKYLGWREPNKSKRLHWKAILVRFTCGISLLFTVAAGRPRRHFSLWVLPLWSKYYCWRLHKWAGTEIPATSCAFFVCRRKQIEVNHSSNTSVVAVVVACCHVMSLIACCCSFRSYSGTFPLMSPSYRPLTKKPLTTTNL